MNSRRNTNRIALLFVIVLLLAPPAFAYVCVGPEPVRDWAFSAPGGAYGFVEMPGAQTYVALGPIVFSVPSTAPVVASVSFCVIALAIGVPAALYHNNLTTAHRS